MASNSGVATLRNFCRAQGPQKCLLESSPNPLYFGTNCPKVPVRCTVVCGPSLSFLGLIFTLVCYAEQMINVRFYCHGLPHLPLGIPVFCILHRLNCTFSRRCFIRADVGGRRRNPSFRQIVFLLWDTLSRSRKSRGAVSTTPRMSQSSTSAESCFKRSDSGLHKAA